MDLRHVRYFVAIAEELHYGRAAERLGISQPPLSQQIQALERELGTELFRRSKRSVSLTKAGEALLPEAYRLLDQAARVKSLAKRAEAGEIGRLFLGCVASACFEILPPILGRFARANPEIGVTVREFDTADAIPALAEGRLDLGLVRIDAVAAPLRILPLRRDRFVIALPVAHRLAGQRRVALDDLRDEPFVMFARRVSPRFFDSIIAAFIRAGFSPDLTHETSSIQSQVAFVACGLGVALVPSTTRRMRLPGVVYRDLRETIPLTDIALVWNGETASTLVTRMVDVVRATAEDSGGDGPQWDRILDKNA
jgi:DNA-binding transcriptional LysR family regulator